MNKIITISREYGAGGHTSGKRVAQELGIEFYARDIVRETAKASGFDPELIENEGEDVSRTDSILKTICSASSLQFNDTQEVIHDVQQAIIVRLAQKGPCVILGRCADEVSDMSVYRENREILCRELKAMGYEFIEPQGAFYMFIDIRKFGMDSVTFCTRMLKEGLVGLIPGIYFGTEGFMRLSYCYSDQDLKVGLDRVEQFLQSL